MTHEEIEMIEIEKRKAIALEEISKNLSAINEKLSSVVSNEDWCNHIRIKTVL